MGQSVEEAEYEKNQAMAAEAARREELARAEAASRQQAAEGAAGTTTCTSCRKEVPSRETQFTADGSVCDECFRSANA